MKRAPLQLVIIDLEDGRRGVFVGRPLVPEESDDEDCQVENVWFTDIRDVPPDTTLEQLTKLALAQIPPRNMPLQ